MFSLFSNEKCIQDYVVCSLVEASDLNPIPSIKIDLEHKGIKYNQGEIPEELPDLKTFCTLISVVKNGLPCIGDHEPQWPEFLTDSSILLPYDFLWELEHRDMLDIENSPDIEEFIWSFKTCLPEVCNTKILPSFLPHKIQIDNVSAIGQNDFRLKCISKIKSGRRSSMKQNLSVFVDVHSEGESTRYLLNKKQFQLMSLVRDFNAELTDMSPNQVLKQLAHFKNSLSSLDLAIEKDYILSPYLSDETPILMNDFSFSVSENDDIVELRPKFVGNSLDDFNDTLIKPLPANGFFTDKQGEKSVRILPNEEVKDSLKKAQKVRSVKKEDLPDLMDQFELQFGTSIDIEDFSKRVKEIGVFVYKPQSYLEKDSGKDWWELQNTLDLDPMFAEDPPLDSVLSLPLNSIPELDELKQKVDDAVKVNKRYIQYEEQFLLIDPPETIYGYIETKKAQIKASEDPDYRSKVPPNILIIYENLEVLDYSEETNEGISSDIAIVSKPTSLKPSIQLKTYQLEGYYWLNHICETKSMKGGLLADDMGLGKTLQLICLLARLKEQGILSPTLIVVPVSLMKNWKEEIEKFIEKNTLTLYSYYNRHFDISKVENTDITITTYDTVRIRQLELGKVAFKCLILDEAQKIKNSYTRVALAIKALKSEVRIAVTGTPVENTLLDLWSLFDFFSPGYLDSQAAFKREFVSPMSNQSFDSEHRADIAASLKKKIKGRYIRRTKTGQLSKELPPINYHSMNVELSDLQKRYYKTLLQYSKDPTQILPTLQKMLMVCAHPFLIQKENITENYLNDCPKLTKTIEIVEAIKSKNEKVLIFVRYLKLQEMIQKLLETKYNIVVQIINGSVKGSQRHNYVDVFNKLSGFQVMIVSPRAGGTGLNVVGANHVICYTRPWNPAIEKQAIDRVYRIGQEREVHVYYPIVSSSDSTFKTVEEQLDILLSEKQTLLTDFIQPIDSLKIKLEDFNVCFNESVDSETTFKTIFEVLSAYEKLECLASIAEVYLDSKVHLRVDSANYFFSFCVVEEKLVKLYYHYKVELSETLLLSEKTKIEEESGLKVEQVLVLDKVSRSVKKQFGSFSFLLLKELEDIYNKNFKDMSRCIPFAGNKIVSFNEV